MRRRMLLGFVMGALFALAAGVLYFGCFSQGAREQGASRPERGGEWSYHPKPVAQRPAPPPAVPGADAPAAPPIAAAPAAPSPAPPPAEAQPPPAADAPPARQPARASPDRLLSRTQPRPKIFTSDHDESAGRVPDPDGYLGQHQGGDGRRKAQEIPRPLLPRLLPGEELWIVERTDPNMLVKHTDDLPGTGAMLAKLRSAEKEVPMPLKHTDVKAAILGYIATVDVTQQFHNPYDEKIEAVYVFPLPSNAAVNEFIMTVGERRIRGIIREREEAERLYADARRQGYVASLLTQERPNIFTQKIANIEPGKAIDVNIKYFHTLAYADGAYEFVFPMVVGPRFNPPGSTGGVGAVARGAHGVSGQKTEVQYLKPGERSGHDIAVAVDVDAAVEIESIECASHAADVERPTPEKARVALRPADFLPNKDFVLRYKVAGKRIKSGFVAHRDARGGFFTLMVFPPEDVASLRRAPMEMVFVLDCSGSMSGAPLAKAKTAMERALRRLDPDDTFQIVRFSDRASAMGAAPVPATPANVGDGLRYLAGLNSEGGTMMIEGIRAALAFPHDPKRLRVVSFMTDGYIGNEAEIFGEVHRLLGPTRLFSFGVGTSVNRYLLEGLAVMGKGAVAYVAPDDSGGREVDRFYERIRYPALTDVGIDWGGLEVSDVYPQRLPDLFVGRPVVVTGRFSPASKPASIRVGGKVAGEPRELVLHVDPEKATTHPSLPAVWARMKIAELADFAEHPAATAENAPQVKRLALEYGLMSAYTAFIAVDSSRVTEGSYGTTVPVAVPVPEGVKYQTTVQEKK